MIKVDLYRPNTTNYFTGVKLDLLPTEIIVHFKDKTFNFFYSDIISYKCQHNKAGTETVLFELGNSPKNLNIIIKPYTKEGYTIICEHFDTYCNNSLVFIENPIFKM